MPRHRVFRVQALLLRLTLVASAGLHGCGDQSAPEGSASGDSTGTVVVDGSSTVYRISKAAQEAYNEVKPDVAVVVDNHGTGGGFDKYLKGEVDVVDASRDAKPDEASRAKAQGIEWTRFLIAYDGITLVVNPKNDFVKSLSVAQLKAIWEPNSKVTTWKDIDPSWPDRKIVLYSPDKDSGTFEFFSEAVVGKAKAQREDVQPSPDDNILVTGVAGDTDALGYFGYAYYAANASKLRAIPVQKDVAAKPVTPSKETVLDKSYTPLSRPLYIFAKNSSLRRPDVGGFVRFYLENAGKFAEKAGYVAPHPDDTAANAKVLAAATGGGAVASAPVPVPVSKEGRP